jgi:hypothetical protein
VLEPELPPEVPFDRVQEFEQIGFSLHESTVEPPSGTVVGDAVRVGVHETIDTPPDPPPPPPDAVQISVACVPPDVMVTCPGYVPAEV